MSWLIPEIQYVLDIIAENVYPGVFAAALIETIIPPIPSEVVFPLAGYSILASEMSSWHVIGVGITGGAGATLGAYIIFLLSKILGRKGLTRYAKRVRISEKQIRRAEEWFAKYGDKSVLVGRCVPGIREIVSIPAGILNMKTTKFLIYTFTGSCTWSTALTAAGYYLGTATILI